MHTSIPARLLTALLGGMLMVACGTSVEDHIDRLQEGGDGAEDAKMALSLARQDAIDPLIAAFADVERGPAARAHMADALGRLYLREKDPNILTTLHWALDDESAQVRTGVVSVAFLFPFHNLPIRSAIPGFRSGLF